MAGFSYSCLRWRCSISIGLLGRWWKPSCRRGLLTVWNYLAQAILSRLRVSSAWPRWIRRRRERGSGFFLVGIARAITMRLITAYVANAFGTFKNSMSFLLADPASNCFHRPCHFWVHCRGDSVQVSELLASIAMFWNFHCESFGFFKGHVIRLRLLMSIGWTQPLVGVELGDFL